MFIQTKTNHLRHCEWVDVLTHTIGYEGILIAVILRNAFLLPNITVFASEASKDVAGGRESEVCELRVPRPVKEDLVSYRSQ